MIDQDPITVLCVDDSPQMARLLERVINREPGMRSLGTLFSADGLVEEVKRLAPRVVLLDLGMPGRDPMQALREIAGSLPQTRVLVVTGHSDPQIINEALAHGAAAFIVKGCGIDPLLDAIRKAADFPLNPPTAICA
jgi:DNA-binding NarL/FixJ family response regulator